MRWDDWLVAMGWGDMCVSVARASETSIRIEVLPPDPAIARSPGRDWLALYDERLIHAISAPLALPLSAAERLAIEEVVVAWVWMRTRLRPWLGCARGAAGRGLSSSRSARRGMGYMRGYIPGAGLHGTGLSARRLWRR